MKLKIPEAIKLHNARKSEENKRNGVHIEEGHITELHLAELMYPNSSYESYSVSYGKIRKGKMKTFQPEWISIICEVCGVDANFLFGIGDSHYNEEYYINFTNKK